MDEIDKKIKGIENWWFGRPTASLPLLNYYRKRGMADIAVLLDQLKECREELRQWDIAAKDGP